MTPVVAVLREIKDRYPRVELRFWTDKSFYSQAKSMIADFDETVPVHTITAGKFRRFNHVSLFRQFFLPSLFFRNFRDLFRVIGGFLQSLTKLILWRPDVVFAKGGYVCLPVGMAARLLRIPLVIHDSDAHPGLTNRVLSKWATYIATGAPLEFYPYPKSKSKYVGIPIAPEFHPYNLVQQREAKREWGIDSKQPLIVVTGGGLGATRINNTVATTLNSLQKYGSVILVAGQGQYDSLRAILPDDSIHFQLYPFVPNMHSLLGAADLVVTRAGATVILELAALKKPTILIPNAKLTGGHQVKNAIVYEEADAVKVIDEEEMMTNPAILAKEIKSLLDNPDKMQEMAEKLSEFAKPNAASDVVDMILDAKK